MEIWRKVGSPTLRSFKQSLIFRKPPFSCCVGTWCFTCPALKKSTRLRRSSVFIQKGRTGFLTSFSTVVSADARPCPKKRRRLKPLKRGFDGRSYGLGL